MAYHDLLFEAFEYAGANNATHLFPLFLNQAELKFNRVLRVSQMETIDTLALTDGDATLPADFLEAREIRRADKRVLKSQAWQQLTESYADRGGLPGGYAIIGGVIKTRPISDDTLTLVYYAKIPPLTPAAPTNWLLEAAPDVYLYGIVLEIAIWQRDPDKMKAAGDLLGLAIKGLMLNDERMRWANSEVVVPGPTP